MSEKDEEDDSLGQYASPPCFMHELSEDYRSPAAADPQADREERKRLLELLHEAGQAVPQPDTVERTPEAFNQHKSARLKRIRAQRDALLDARDDGTFSADALAGALSNLDADEISIDLKGDPTEATG